MATTDRGIYYTTSADDAIVADLNVITKAIADSTEAAIDMMAAAVPVHAIGTRATSMALPYTSATTITWTAEVDPSGMLGASSFTLPSAGIYQVSACADCTASDEGGDGHFVTQIWQNNDMVAYATTPRSPHLQGVDGASAVSTTIVAAAGDTLQLRIWNAYLSGATACTFARMTVVRVGA